MLPLQAVRIQVRADRAEELRHAFPFTLRHHLPGFVDNRVPARALLEGHQHIGPGNGDHEISGIDLDRNSLAVSGTVVRDGHDVLARASERPEGRLEQSRGVNPPEVRMLECEEFRGSGNVYEVHAQHFTATAASLTGGMVSLCDSQIEFHRELRLNR